MSCHVFLSGEALAIQAPYYMKDVCKSIPGARWKPDLKMWTYPATPSAAREIHLTLPQSETSWAEPAAVLLVEADRMAKAQAHKTADDLPAIPWKSKKHYYFQLQGFHFAKDLPAVLLDVHMGGGKSRMAIDLITHRQCHRTLIICPKSVIDGVWPDQFAEHATIPFGLLTLNDGTMSSRSKKLEAFLDLQRARHQSAVVIINYDAAWRPGMAESLLRTTWDAVILDESHRCKAPGGKAAMFVSRLGDKVPFRICLTGTPMPHSPLDIYGQYRFLDKGIFGTSFTAFRARYARMGGYGNHQVMGYENQDDLRRKIYSIAFRIDEHDIKAVQGLPEYVDIRRPVILSAYAKKLYQALKTEFVVGVADGTVTASNALTRLLRLQQIGSGWARQDRNIETGDEGQLLQIDTAKQDALADLMEDLNDEEPIVIFCRFHHDLDAVHTVAAALGRASAELSGRRNELANWQQGPTPVLAVQIQSGGVGINLVRARYCVFYSLGFSLGEYLQARKRIHRPGQAHNCTYYHLIAKGTVDEQVYKALEARQDVVESVLKGVKA